MLRGFYTDTPGQTDNSHIPGPFIIVLFVGRRLQKRSCSHDKCKGLLRITKIARLHCCVRCVYVSVVPRCSKITRHPLWFDPRVSIILYVVVIVKICMIQNLPKLMWFIKIWIMFVCQFDRFTVKYLYTLLLRCAYI